jgi:hypothetical protein
MARSNIQSDRFVGDNLKRGTIPANVHFETEAERIAELTANANSLPPDSTARQTIIEVLRRDYGVNL